MPRETLESQLTQLRDELTEADALDPRTRRLLAEVAEDIEQVLADESASRASLTERIEAAAYRFEAEHPRFAAILTEINDTLAKLGI